MKRDLDALMLTRQELQIMKVVWERQSASVREVCMVISQQKPTAYTTILTLMGILEQKGALTHIRSGRAYIYRPLLSCEQATRNQVHDLVVRFFDGKSEKLVKNLLENEIQSKEGLANIRRLVDARCRDQVA